MPVKCKVIVNELEKLAPQFLAESWDNVGLLLGSMDQKVERILVALDVTEAVVKYAVNNNIDLIISHHPLIFKSINAIRTDEPQGKLIAELLKADIAVYAMHTNLDAASGGVNDILAQKLNLQQVKPLSITAGEKLYKVAVFVPVNHVEEVRDAMTEAGAGFIGNYSKCTFATTGQGAFMPLDKANPFIGQIGQLEYVTETKIETIVPEQQLSNVIQAMLNAHPYEEVAYDIYPLVNKGKLHGLGRIGRLPVSQRLSEFVAVVKCALGTSHVSVVGSLNKMITTIAVCGGSGATLIQKAALNEADVLVTGDVKYHQAQEAMILGIAVIDAGHFATEVPVVNYIESYLQQCAAANEWSVDITADSTNKDVFVIV